MAAPTKQASRWGSFLQQALDGVESKLDNILVGDGQADPPGRSSPAPSATTAKSDIGPSRNAVSSNASNDRLQERLARAIAAKKVNASRTDSQASNSAVPSRTGSPVTVVDTPRHSIDNASNTSQNGTDVKTEGLEAGIAAKEEGAVDSVTPGDERSSAPPKDSSTNNVLDEQFRSAEEVRGAETLSTESSARAPQGDALTGNEDARSSLEMGATGANTTNVQRHASVAQQGQNDGAFIDLQRQEEIHGYIERIDALQSKLQYLARESLDSARRAAATSTTAAEKKLAEKDEQIALLIEEGQKLAKTELKHMTIIKKLRLKNSEAERETADIKKRLDKILKENETISGRLKGLETVQKSSLETQRTITQLQRDIEILTAARDAQSSTITDLKAQLARSTEKANTDRAEALEKLLAAERLRVPELENDLSSLKIEKELASGRAKAKIEELQTRLEREAQRSRVLEVEMRAEQQMLESRLELMRTRAEEVSTGSTGDAQAKLLRQIETLQMQYAIASENWQGIESSLVARATSLERERDDALKRESDVRRKAREMTSKAKHDGENLLEAEARIDGLEKELLEQREQVEKLQQRISEKEAAWAEVKKAFEDERQALKAEIQQHIDEDRSRWREEPLAYGGAETGSPAMSHRNLTADLLGLQNLQTRTQGRSFSGELPTPESRAGRKSSAPRMRHTGNGTPQRQDSAQAIHNGLYPLDPLTVPPRDLDGDSDHVRSPSPTTQTIQDAVSVSTVGAGPSVQLVERMSAAVRRLESEKVSTKEELKRLSAQRDEARNQIVKLMQEVEVKRQVEARVRALEEENVQLNARYQTTLEMLGEKSELVEELKADVQDVKDMYRELVQRTIK